MSVVALIHPTGLLGTEVRESLERRHDLWREIRLLSTRDEEVGTLTQIAGAAAVVGHLEEDGLDDVDVAFFCGTIEETRPLLEVSPSTTAIVLSPDSDPDDGVPLVAGVNLERARRAEVLLSPHPGTVLLAHLVHPLAAFHPVRATATLVEPVSVHSKEALEEVFEQTSALLRFDTPPRDVFSVQMAFNVIPGQLRAPMAEQLSAVLDRELEWSVQTLQSGVFHSYGATLDLVLDDDPGPETVREALAAHPFVDPAPDPELLGMIDAAGRDELLLGAVDPDPRRPGAYRIWAVMDNLTVGGALNALHILEAVSNVVN